MEKIKKREKGITLIALVVTIILLLLLAGVSIQMLTGQNGILKRAKESERNTNKESLREQIQLELMDTYDEDGYDTEKLKEKLKEDYNVDENDILDTEEGGFAFPLDGYIVKVEKNEKGVPKVEIEGDGNRENLPTPPTLLGSDTKIDFDPNDWTNTGVKVTITLDEKIDKGGSVLQYSIDEGQTWNTYRNPFEIVENNTVIIARLYNGVNESSGYATATVTKIDKIEPTAPNVEIGTGAVLGNEDWYRSEVTIKITEGTDYESGVEKTTYVITGAQETAETEGKEVKITKEGKSYITAYTYDKAGNKKGSRQIEIKKDTKAPTLTLKQIDTTTREYSKEVEVIATDETSDIQIKKYANREKAKEYFITNGTVIDNNNITIESQNLSKEDLRRSPKFEYTFYAKDKAGNETIETIELQNMLLDVKITGLNGVCIWAEYSQVDENSGRITTPDCIFGPYWTIPAGQYEVQLYRRKFTN